MSISNIVTFDENKMRGKNNCILIFLLMCRSMQFRSSKLTSKFSSDDLGNELGTPFRMFIRPQVSPMFNFINSMGFSFFNSNYYCATCDWK